MNDTDQTSVVNFLFETGMMARTPRSGFHFMGEGSQSLADHTNRVVFIGYVLCQLDPTLNLAKIMQMCLFHDLAEVRTSDPNYVYKKYIKINEEKATEDTVKDLPFGGAVTELLQEYHAHQTPEAIAAKEADRLEWIMTLKEWSDIGNKKAAEWLESGINRMDTKIGKELAIKIASTSSDDWWFGDRNDAWWHATQK
jgi:putative hydrolase of HD superfamily